MGRGSQLTGAVAENRACLTEVEVNALEGFGWDKGTSPVERETCGLLDDRVWTGDR